MADMDTLQLYQRAVVLDALKKKKKNRPALIMMKLKRKKDEREKKQRSKGRSLLGSAPFSCCMQMMLFELGEKTLR